MWKENYLFCFWILKAFNFCIFGMFSLRGSQSNISRILQFQISDNCHVSLHLKGQEINSRTRKFFFFFSVSHLNILFGLIDYNRFISVKLKKKNMASDFPFQCKPYRNIGKHMFLSIKMKMFHILKNFNSLNKRLPLIFYTICFVKIFYSF